MVKRVICGVVVLSLVLACGSCGFFEPDEYTPETSKIEALPDETAVAISSDNYIFETTVSSSINIASTSISGKATVTTQPSTRDFPYPDKSIFKLEMEDLPKTEYKVGEMLEVTTKLTNTASRGYGLVWQYYLIKAWLERVGDDPLPTITPMGLPYLSANETILNRNINGLAGHSESYVFSKAGTYWLTVSTAFEVCNFTGTEDEWEKVRSSYLDTGMGKKSYSYALTPIVITVTD